MEAMEAMLLRYTADFPEHQTNQSTARGEVILLTGSTGALGRHILYSLLELPEVSLVYALNREDPQNQNLSVRERHLAVFADSGLDVQVLHSPKLRFLVGDLELSNLGLAEPILQEIRQDITCVIHNGTHACYYFGYYQ